MRNLDEIIINLRLGDNSRYGYDNFEDCKKLQSIISKNFLCILSLPEVELLWKTVSYRHSAGWYDLPSEEIEITEMIRRII